MHSLITCLLPLALLALLHSVTPASEQQRPLSGPSPRQASLGLLLKKRSLASAIRAPSSAFFSDSLNEPTLRKRDDGYWIWMPAHGYMPVPSENLADDRADQDSMGNLLRYG